MHVVLLLYLHYRFAEKKTIYWVVFRMGNEFWVRGKIIKKTKNAPLRVTKFVFLNKIVYDVIATKCLSVGRMLHKSAQEGSQEGSTLCHLHPVRVLHRRTWSWSERFSPWPPLDDPSGPSLILATCPIQFNFREDILTTSSTNMIPLRISLFVTPSLTGNPNKARSMHDPLYNSYHVYRFPR